MVRMGELAVSRTPDAVLVSLGLGSCIGLALVGSGVAGLAHVVLPESPPAGASGTPGKFGDTAVPALVAELAKAGAPLSGLRAVLVGGAQMFAFGSSGDIGGRNEAATRAALAEAGIPVVAACTSGITGRTVRVHVGSGRVVVKEAGYREVELFSGRLAA